MKDHLVTIYRRADGHWYLHRHNWTTMGITLACPPFIPIAPDKIEDVIEAVAELLATPPDTVAHPKSFDQLEPLFELAGCSNWKEFVKKASCLHIQQTETDVLIMPTERNGAGFRHLTSQIIRSEMTGIRDHLLAALKRDRP